MDICKKGKMQELQFFFNGLKKISVIWKFPNSILLENFLLVRVIVDRDSGKIISLKILIAHNVESTWSTLIFRKWSTTFQRGNTTQF